MYCVRGFKRRMSTLGFVCVAAITIAAVSQGCRRSGHADVESAGFAMHDSSDCLPNIALIDQHGEQVVLASLKGKPVLFDFIYSSCPGPCLLLTQRMKKIASQLGPRLGASATIVSVTVDPEHDRPAELLQYAKDQGADLPGWLFLTGPPSQIDDVMARFKLIRRREDDGSVDHVLEFFLVGPDGRSLMQYVGEKAASDQVAADVLRVAAGEKVTMNDGSSMPVTY
jgi:cytochrome oxidase Cu insertion factor (SCO1/SenC/PrrC family)